jgi:hypothetical protein
MDSPELSRTWVSLGRKANGARFGRRWTLLNGGIGGVEGDRTLDLRIANATLSQLSYHPEDVIITYSRAREPLTDPSNRLS